MSDQIKHECGVALVRLLKPLSYYQEKYGTSFYGINKMQILMQKMRHRGQDGAGLCTIKLDTEPGKRFISIKKSNSPQALVDVFGGINQHFKDLTPAQLADPVWLKEEKPYMGELLLGHLRYGTHGKNTLEHVHPFLRQSNWINRTFVLAGNFNMTNVDELFDELVKLGQYPKEKSDTVTVLEKLGHFLDDEVQRLHTWHKPDGLSNQEINKHIFDSLDIQRLLRRACKKLDGGYVLAGLIGHGDAFVIRDPNGIRPAYYYADDEVVVVASERPAIMTAFNLRFPDVKELKAGHALIIKHHGKVSEVPYTEPRAKTACSFERIYFSRGTDKEIYEERKRLGELLVPPILKAIQHDFENTVFSFIPDTAESAFFGLIQGLNKHLNEYKKEQILALSNKKITPEALDKIMNMTARVEKIVVKDQKQRTFITNDAARGGLVSHIYDVTYGIVRNEIDTLVLLDDSIVRGTTMRENIIRSVWRLRPKKIVIVSSSPQIRYPDCYGIDMSRMREFVAFQALVELLKAAGREHLIQEAYQRCKLQESLPVEIIKNAVTPLYDLFSYDEITQKIAEIVTPHDIDPKPKVEVIYQTMEGLHEACPNHTGDWYFTGNYPTAGGNRVVNRAFMNFVENKDARAY
jgi:amidophosphoribosyltransferase